MRTTYSTTSSSTPESGRNVLPSKAIVYALELLSCTPSVAPRPPRDRGTKANRDVHVAPRDGGAALHHSHDHERKANNHPCARRGLRSRTWSPAHAASAEVPPVRDSAAQHSRPRQRARSEACTTPSDLRTHAARATADNLRDHTRTRAKTQTNMQLPHSPPIFVTANLTFG